MSKRVDINPRTGAIETFEYDELTGVGKLHITEDVSSVLELNKIHQNDGNNGWSKSRELKRVASIPTALATKWLNEEGLNVLNEDHWPAIKRKLNSNEYLYLRTSSGRI